MFKKGLVCFLAFLCLFFNFNIAVLCANEEKYPDYAYEFIGEDKHENLNRKMFSFNLGLNKYLLRPVHILWSSIMPEFGMDRIKGISNNIEYPIRLVSSLIQRDFKTSKNETIRFFTNTILGLGGMFDPAKHLFGLEQANENMEQALAGCKIKSGSFFVLPILSFVTPRGILGKLLDTALNPGCYIATPVLAMIKAGLLINKSSYAQPLFQMLENTYADPYEIAKKYFALDTYIKCANLDRVDLNMPEQKKKENIEIVEDKKEVLKAQKPDNIVPKPANIVKTEVYSELLGSDILKGGTNVDEFLKDFTTENFKLGADIFLIDYNPQHPVIDSMRTALFDLPDVDKSLWNELSIWNRSFIKRIKTDSIQVADGREPYVYKYILQKDKKAPVVIVYPSIGEGVCSYHSALLGKLFYDKGYSVVIQGSHFHWEFVKSMPEGYKPGLPTKDADSLRNLTAKILESLNKKYGCVFPHKVLIGTSFGALATLFIAEKESRYSMLGDAHYIAICPPIDLIYAMKQIDKNSEDWNKSPEEFKSKVALTAAKVQKLLDSKDSPSEEINFLPFTEEEAKMITGFIMHQKLSDLVFTIEKSPTTSKSNTYSILNNMNYQNYTEKYLLSNLKDSVEDLSYEVSLHSISDFLEYSNDYKIYHSLNDYLTNTNQLRTLKDYTGKRTILFDNGAHLGFLYRKEFIDDLNDTISSILAKKVATN